jgi:glutamate carboxypeptidase
MTAMVERARLEGLIQELLPEALRWLERMVAVNSFTGNRAGVNALGRLTEECFAGMGFVAERIPAGNAAWGDHLVLRRGRNAGVSLAMITHLDTVFPPEEELRNGFHWRRAGDWVYGPGTNDIKGGTVVAWMTLTALWRGEPRLFEAVDWSLFCNAAEETFAIDFGNLVRERLTRTTLAALVFEGEGREGAARRMVVARKGRGTWRIPGEIIGEAPMPSCKPGSWRGGLRVGRTTTGN